MKSITILFLLLSTSIYAHSQNTFQHIIKLDIKLADSFFTAHNWGMAKQVYEEVLKDTTKNGLAWNRLGFSYYNLQIYDASLKCFKKSLSQTSNPVFKAIAYSRMARIHAIKNDKKSAFTELDSAISLGYSNVSEMDTLSDYKKLRNDNYFNHLRDQVYLNRNPCMGDSHAREFDFWAGEWDVFVTGTKNYAGHSLVQIISGGCALLENWDSPASTGKSINFIDPVMLKWKQVWAGSYAGGIQEFVNGEYKDSAMHFDYTTIDAQGNKINGRFIFYNQGSNQVRQFNETSNDGGKTWTTSYDFTYIRKR